MGSASYKPNLPFDRVYSITTPQLDLLCLPYLGQRKLTVIIPTNSRRLCTMRSSYAVTWSALPYWCKSCDWQLKLFCIHNVKKALPPPHCKQFMSNVLYSRQSRPLFVRNSQIKCNTNVVVFCALLFHCFKIHFIGIFSVMRKQWKSRAQK